VPSHARQVDNAGKTPVRAGRQAWRTRVACSGPVQQVSVPQRIALTGELPRSTQNELSEALKYVRALPFGNRVSEYLREFFPVRLEELVSLHRSSPASIAGSDNAESLNETNVLLVHACPSDYAAKVLAFAGNTIGDQRASWSTTPDRFSDEQAAHDSAPSLLLLPLEHAVANLPLETNQFPHPRTPPPCVLAGIDVCDDCIALYALASNPSATRRRSSARAFRCASHRGYTLLTSSGRIA
jgi:hypothetical protein